MKQVREVAFDSEDCIDTFSYHIGIQHVDKKVLGCFLRVHPLRTMKVRHSLAIEIQSLKTRAQKVSERRLRYKLEAAGPTSSCNNVLLPSSSCIDLDHRLSALNIDESRLVGMVDKTKYVIKLLEEGHVAELKVVSIVGFGGVGKTTLARTVYKSPLVQGIQCRAFIAVSQNYDLRALLESVLKQLLRGSTNAEEGDAEDPLRGIETWDISKLIRHCRSYLVDKRYPLVLSQIRIS